jgi:two-component system response regulator FixJ
MIPIRSGDVVHVVDDDEAVRGSLRFLLEAAGFAVRTHATAEAFLRAVEAEEPIGCVLTDLRMPGLGGLELQAQLLADRRRIPVIVITGHGDVPSAVRAMKEGALDFLEKPFDDEQLLATVCRALEAGRAMQAASQAAAAAASRLATLTRREREVLEGMVAGQASKTIARDLGASPRTIEVHRIRVMEKLQVRSLPELVRLVQAAKLAGQGRRP